MAFCRRWRRGALFPVVLVLLLPLLLSVSELHRDPIAEGGKVSALKKKFDHLVFGPAAGQGLPDRLQCRGFKALNRMHHSTISQSSSVLESISFVTVFTIYNNSQSTNSISAGNKSTDRVTVGNTSYSKVEKSMAILHTYIDFVQEFLETRLKGLLEMPKHINHYIFTDSDIAVVDDLGHIFQNYPHFHLALTFRNNKDQPINSGFIAVRGTREGILRAKIFLQRVLEVYSSRYMKASRMLGDQLALAWVVKSQISMDSKQFAKPKPFEAEIHGTRVLFLPCAVYNWTPPEGAGQFHGMPLDVKVVHFKGSRKRLMLESWNFFNSSSSLPDMLCLILMSGRTKYDF